MINTKRKPEGDEEQGGGAGVSMHAEPLAFEQARAMVDIARKGGAVTMVSRPESATAYVVVQLRTAGLVETAETIDGGCRIRLTSFGVQRLVEAQRIVAAAPGFSR